MNIFANMVNLLRIRGRLASRLVIYILIWSSIITLALTAYQLYRQYRLDLAGVEQQIEQIRIGSLDSIRNNLWVVNKQNIGIILNSLNALPDIEYLQVVDESGEVIASAGQPVTEHMLSRQYPMDHSHRDRSIALGTLRIDASLAGVYQRLRDQVVVILISQATKTFLVSLFIFFLFQWLVTRHLNLIASWARKLNITGADTPLALDRKPLPAGRGDALTDVVSAFNQMRDNLDTTYRKLMDSHASLNEKVQARTRSLEQANQELSAFSYSVSHDLRAPLRGISGFAQILLEDHQAALDKDGKDLLQRIIKASKRMSGLIDDMLSLARFSQSAMTIVDIDVSNMARGIVHELSESHASRHVEVDIQPDMHVRADATLLRSVMDNLLNNAWKYTAKTAQAHIRVSARKGEQDTVICVEDNGAGFDMAYAQNLFSPFTRLHKESEYEGNGIGLAIVRRIIRRHGGRVWAEGKPDHGARFCFSVPDVIDLIDTSNLDDGVPTVDQAP